MDNITLRDGGWEHDIHKTVADFFGLKHCDQFPSEAMRDEIIDTNHFFTKTCAVYVTCLKRDKEEIIGKVRGLGEEPSIGYVGYLWFEFAIVGIEHKIEFYEALKNMLIPYEVYHFLMTRVRRDPDKAFDPEEKYHPNDLYSYEHFRHKDVGVPLLEAKYTYVDPPYEPCLIHHQEQYLAFIEAKDSKK